MSRERTLADTQLGATLSAGATAPELRAAGEVPRRIGRFTVIRQLGAGGMGVVYAAYDDELDRRVAIKLLRSRGDPRASQGQARLLREAQAMARLSHPNIATVFEVGTWEGQVYMAMEFVSGQSLGDWMEAAPRGWRELLAVFCQAGRGLAAAHQAGLVHRDFKPDNAVIGEDRRVRVLDFGLARAAAADGEKEEDAAPRIDGAAALAGASSLSSTLTATGALLGTPAYMSPEQFLGKPSDARSDQFSFCVSLFEGLYGRRPFAGDTLGELALRVCEGEIADVPRDRSVPGWLHAAVVRGLEPDPTRRWGSMEALLAALERDPTRARRRWLAGLAAAAAIAGAAVGVARATAAADAVCTGGAAALAGAWDGARREAVARGLAATGLPYAQDTAARVVAALDAYAARFMAAHRDACEATAIRREQSEELRERRMTCLDERRKRLAALVEVLSSADAAAVDGAVEAARGLPRIELCSDLTFLGATVRPPDDPEVARRAEALAGPLATIEANEDAGRYAQALALLESITPEVEALGYPPLVVRALRARGSLLIELSRNDEAAQPLERAYFLARAEGLDTHARALAIRLTRLHGDILAKTELGLAWSRHALAEVTRLREPSWEPAYLTALSAVYLRKGDYAESEAACRRALELTEAQPDRSDHDLSRAHRSLGNALMRRGKYAEARQNFERAIELRIAALGPEHPEVGDLEYSVGNALSYEGKHAEARVHLERALALHRRTRGPESVWAGSDHREIGAVALRMGKPEEARAHLLEALRLIERTSGPDHPDVANPCNNLGMVFVKLKRYEEARVYFRRALDVYLRSEPDHPDIASLYNNLGIIDKIQQRYASATENYVKALAVFERRLGPEHPTVGKFHMNIGVLYYAQGDYEAAEEAYRKAIGLLERSLGRDHPDLVMALGNLAEVLRLRGSVKEAVEVGERALAILAGRTDNDPWMRANVELELARSLWIQRERARALALARAARDGYLAAGAGHEEEARQAATWLAERGAQP